MRYLVRGLLGNFGLLLVSAGCGGSQAHEIAYQNRSLVTDVTWLKENLQAPELVIVDARSVEEYQAGHIPQAVHFSWQSLARMEGSPGDQGWGTVLPVTDLATNLADKGVSLDSMVVVYADPPNGWGEDGRLVWQFQAAGLSQAKILDGGVAAWVRAGYSLTTEAPQRRTGQLRLSTYQPDWFADTQWIRDRLSSAKIVDSRAQDEYEGATHYGEARGGRIPGAVHLPFARVLNADGTFRKQTELESLFSSLDLFPDDEIVIYCTAGIRSGHLAVALRLAGYNTARNYDDSFYRWAALSELPVESDTP